MTLYLQKNYNGTFAIAMKGDFLNCEYTTLLDNINGEITYLALIDLLVEKFGCRKLILDF